MLAQRERRELACTFLCLWLVSECITARLSHCSVLALALQHDQRKKEKDLLTPMMSRMVLPDYRRAPPPPSLTSSSTLPTPAPYPLKFSTCLSPSVVPVSPPRPLPRGPSPSPPSLNSRLRSRCSRAPSRRREIRFVFRASLIHVQYSRR